MRSLLPAPTTPLNRHHEPCLCLPRPGCFPALRHSHGLRGGKHDLNGGARAESTLDAERATRELDAFGECREAKVARSCLERLGDIESRPVVAHADGV